MSIDSRLWINVVGDSEDADEGRRLLKWLHSEPELSSAVAVRAPSPHPGEKGPPAATLVATLASEAAIAVLVSTIRAFVSRRHNVKIQITSPTGRTVEVSASKVPDIEPLVQAMSSTGETHSGEAHSVVNNSAIQARDVAGDVIIWRRGEDSDAVDDDSWHPTPEQATSSTLPVTIYLSNEEIHEQVEAAVEQVLTAAGLRINLRDDPILGSWFRRMWATVTLKLHTPAGREAVFAAAHAAETRFVLAPDADVTAKLLQSVGPVITSLEPTKDAVVRLGNVLIVKENWVVAVSQLTPAQQFLLNHRPELVCSPQKILLALNDTALEAPNHTFAEGESGPSVSQ